jgi:hypothetical protein
MPELVKKGAPEREQEHSAFYDLRGLAAAACQPGPPFINTPRDPLESISQFLDRWSRFLDPNLHDAFRAEASAVVDDTLDWCVRKTRESRALPESGGAH